MTSVSPNIQPCCSHELDTGNYVEIAMSSLSSKSTNNEPVGTNLSITTILWLAISGHLWSDFEKPNLFVIRRRYIKNINVGHQEKKIKYFSFPRIRAINRHQLELRVHILKHYSVHYILEIVWGNDRCLCSTT